jgi:hypothetical protein
MIGVAEIATTDLLLNSIGSYRLAYSDEIDQRSEIGINPFLGDRSAKADGGNLIREGNSANASS